MLTSFRVAVTGLRMPRIHFLWQAQYLCYKTSKNRISFWEVDVKLRLEL